MELDYEKSLREIQSRYNELFSRSSFKSIGDASNILEERRRLIRSGNKIGKLDPDIYDKDTRSVFELMFQYQQEIKRFFVTNGLSLTHVTEISPEKMIEGKIHRSICPNHYENEIGNWVFASSTPMDGRNPYLARCQQGMIRISENAYIYGGDNFEVVQNEEGKKILMLKRPNFVYELNPIDFTPVVSIERDKMSKLGLVFSEEWVSDSDVDISDGNTVRSVSEISDITELLKFYHIFSDVRENGIGRQVLSSRNKIVAFNTILENYSNGNLRYFNDEVGINASSLVKPIKKSSSKFDKDEEER